MSLYCYGLFLSFSEPAIQPSSQQTKQPTKQPTNQIPNQRVNIVHQFSLHQKSLKFASLRLYQKIFLIFIMPFYFIPLLLETLKQKMCLIVTAGQYASGHKCFCMFMTVSHMHVNAHILRRTCTHANPLTSRSRMENVRSNFQCNLKQFFFWFIFLLYYYL